MSWRRCVLPNMVRGVKFPSQAWGIRPITMHWIAGQSEHTTLFRMMSFVKNLRFRKLEQRGATIICSMSKIMCFLKLKPRKHSALHQIMLFLASSYEPFKLLSVDKTNYKWIIYWWHMHMMIFDMFPYVTVWTRYISTQENYSTI